MATVQGDQRTLDRVDTGNPGPGLWALPAPPPPGLLPSAGRHLLERRGPDRKGCLWYHPSRLRALAVPGLRIQHLSLLSRCGGNCLRPALALCPSGVLDFDRLLPASPRALSVPCGFDCHVPLCGLPLAHRLHPAGASLHARHAPRGCDLLPPAQGSQDRRDDELHLGRADDERGVIQPRLLSHGPLPGVVPIRWRNLDFVAFKGGSARRTGCHPVLRDWESVDGLPRGRRAFRSAFPGCRATGALSSLW